MYDKNRIWNAVLGEIELMVSKAQFNTWIKNTFILDMTDETITVCVPNSFTKDWLINKFNTAILKSIQNITRKVPKIKYVVKNSHPANDAQNSRNTLRKAIDLKKKFNPTPSIPEPAQNYTDMSRVLPQEQNFDEMTEVTTNGLGSSPSAFLDFDEETDEILSTNSLRKDWFDSDTESDIPQEEDSFEQSTPLKIEPEKKETSSSRFTFHPNLSADQNKVTTPFGNNSNEQEPLADTPFAKAEASNDTGLLNPRYTFESFIVGSSNELAHAAALCVAQDPGMRYNPLFIYGGVGLGKTHLIQAIANEILKNGKKVRYVTSDTFISDLMEAFRTGKVNEFKDKHRAVDLLMIDDIQFIAGKEKTQEEVFNTFNELYAHNKQIIITSDRPPSSIKPLNDRLKSRFEGGMIADIILPDFEMRAAILESKCRQKNFHMEKEHLHLVAEHIKSNVRELEGVLNKIIARVQLVGTKLTPELIMKLIEGGNVPTKRSITIESLFKAVEEHFNVSHESIIAATRKQEIAYPRQILMYLIREELGMSFPSIGKAIGGRDHTTILHAYDKIKTAINHDFSTEQEINIIRDNLFNK
jgi:chromosomal replication initiator protein